MLFLMNKRIYQFLISCFFKCAQDFTDFKGGGGGLGSPVQQLASHSIDAERCTLFWSSPGLGALHVNSLPCSQLAPYEGRSHCTSSACHAKLLVLMIADQGPDNFSISGWLKSVNCPLTPPPPDFPSCPTPNLQLLCPV
jgi:hypothetical protein